MQLPENALAILNLLESKGFVAYVVGGYVRDSLLGGQAGDIDICTDALPESITDVFTQNGYRVLPTGLKHGTVTVITAAAGIEVTTLRVDGSYTDSRHPDSVSFTSDIVEDLARRDFTVNAIAYSQSLGFIDPFGGREDITKRLIRAVGDPAERFAEDALRMLRAVRFAARLGFSIEPETRAAIRSHSDGLRTVSAERIAAELCSILLCERPEVLCELHTLGLLRFVLPGLVPSFERGAAAQALRAVSLLPAELELRLAALFAGDGPGAERELRMLRFSNKNISRISELSSLADMRLEPDAAAVRRFLGTLKNVGFGEYETVRRALLEAAENSEELETLNMCHAVYDMIIRKKEPYLISHLAINGEDVMALGYRGAMTGLALAACLEYVTGDPDKNTVEILTSWLERLCQSPCK